MKSIIIFLILINVAIAAEDFGCDIAVSSEATKLAETFTPVNCLNGVTSRDLNKAFTNTEIKKKICDKCTSPFYKDPKAERIPNSKHKDDFIAASFNELRKGLSQTMLELMSLRNTLELGIDGDDIGGSCKLTKISDDASCSLVPNLSKEIENIQMSLANDFASFYDKKNQSEGIMIKSPNPNCSIEDKDLLPIKNQFIETSLPSLITALSSIKIDYDSIDFSKNLNSKLSEKFRDIKINPLNIEYSDIYSHPLIGPILRDPSALKKFISNAKGSQDLGELRSILYGKEGSSAFAKGLKDKCDDFVNTFKNKICGPEVNRANISLNSKSDLEIVIDHTVSIIPPNLDKTKEGMINYCEDDFLKNNNTVSFSSIQESLTQGLPDQYKEMKYSSFKAEAYKNQVEVQRDALCKISDGSMKCEAGTQLCELFTQWKQSQKPESTAFKLLGAHDSNIDKILRSLIGTPHEIPETTKAILVAQGIYPDPITKKYAITDIPERKTDFYKSEAASPASIPQPQTNTQTASATKYNAPKPVADNTYVAPPVNYSTDYGNVPASTTSQITSSDDTIRNNLQKQILDRLNNQVSAKQIEDMVAKAYNQGRSVPLTPQQVTAKTQEIFDDMPIAMPAYVGGSSSTPTGKASVSQDKEKTLKDKQMAFYKAMYGGKDQVGTGNNLQVPTESAKSKVSEEGYPIVEVKTADELKIVVSDLKNAKASEIAELMKKKENFILQIGNVPYTIAFVSGKMSITPPKGLTRDPATISKLEEYILNLANPSKTKDVAKAQQIDNGLYNELRKVNYKE